jgi:subtilisin family serine protease
MSRHVRTTIVATLVLATLLIGTPASGADAMKPLFPSDTGARWAVPGEIVVMFAAGVGRAEARELHQRVDTEVVSRVPRFQVEVVRVPATTSIEAAIRGYERDPRVLFAEQNRVVVPFDTPTDPMFADQWSLNNTGQSHRISDLGLSPTVTGSGTADADVDGVEAWDVTTGGSGPVIAVIDTGVDIDHPDLVNSLWVSPGEIAGNGMDDDGNGFIDDVHGWDFQNDDGDPSPPSTLDGSHGTHVAGIIAAARNDGVGITGVCPGCRIMALRFDFTTSTELEAIDYAIANGADAINMSYGGPVWSNAEREAIRQAGISDVLTVASAGNASLDNDIPLPLGEDFAPSFPASYNLPTVLSVAASNHRDQYGWFSQCQPAGIPRWRCAFTSWGHDSVDVAAPGVDILSSVVEGEAPDLTDHDVWDGTSMAAPLVAGIAGLVLDQNPAYTPGMIKNAIMNSVDRPDALKLYTAYGKALGVGKRALSGRFTRTQGRVNANSALTGSDSNATPVTDGNVDGARRVRTSVRGRVAWPADVNDVYRKRLRKRVRYEVVLDGPRRSDLDLWVFNPGTKEIWQFTLGCFTGRSCPALRASSLSADADERVVFRARKTGAHYIVVNGFYSGGHYRLVVRKA